MIESDIKNEDLNEEQIKQNEKPSEPIQIQKQVFKCHLCGIYANYSYYGNKVLERNQDSSAGQQKKQTKKENLILIEKSYICDDPFSELRSINYLILGANCFECNQMVCVSAECSFFYYNKRFCLKCANDHIQDDKKRLEFPVELINEIKKIVEK
jgi:hypothetical protein